MNINMFLYFSPFLQISIFKNVNISIYINSYKYNINVISVWRNCSCSCLTWSWNTRSSLGWVTPSRQSSTGDYAYTLVIASLYNSSRWYRSGCSYFTFMFFVLFSNYLTLFVFDEKYKWMYIQNRIQVFKLKKQTI